MLTVDGERFLERLAAAGAVECTGPKVGVWKLKDLPGLEIRVGGRKRDGSVLQFQSVCPPTPGADGRPREWDGVETIAELPLAAYETLAEIPEAFGYDRKEMQEADHGGCADLPLTGGNGAVKLAPPTGTPLSVGNGVASGGNGVVKHEPARPSPEERAAEYLETVEPAISGQGGHKATFRAACIPVRFGITDPETVYRLLLPWNERCLPPWSEDDLRHKAEDACKIETRPDLGQAPREIDTRSHKLLNDKGTSDSISTQDDTTMYNGTGIVNRLPQKRFRTNGVPDSSDTSSRLVEWDTKPATPEPLKASPEETGRGTIFDDRGRPISCLHNSLLWLEKQTVNARFDDFHQIITINGKELSDEIVLNLQSQIEEGATRLAARRNSDLNYL